jgi:hypothetical protein
MGKKIKKILGLMTAASLLLICIYFLMRSLAVIGHGYSLEEMDWNNDGETSLNELLDASDIGKRTTIENNKTCTE